MMNTMHRLALFGVMAGLVVAADAAAQDRDGWDREAYRLSLDAETVVELDIDAGEVDVSPGTSRDSLIVLLRYRHEDYEHEVSEVRRGKRLRIRFKKDSWVGDVPDRGGPEIEVLLPTHAPISLDGRIKAGEVRMQLGGVHLAAFALKTWAGAVSVDFRDPNLIPLQHFVMNTKIGETRLRRLGNARMLRADINSGIGSLEVDFSGEPLQDARVEIDLDIGETAIRLPAALSARIAVHELFFLSNVRVSPRYRKSGKYYRSEGDGGSGSIDLDVSPGIGEVSIVSR